MRRLKVIFALLVSAQTLFADLKLNSKDVVLFPRETKQLLVWERVGKPGETNVFAELDRTHDARYQSKNDAVVTVNSAGVLRGVKEGSTNVLVAFGGDSLQVAVTVKAIEDAPPVRFETDVVPILTKLSCNSGGCHGKATGQNGFKISLLGFEPDTDFDALTRQAKGRRIFPSAPEQSLLLTKATAMVPHGGGRRLDPNSDDYHLLHRWIREGAAPPNSNDPKLERIELFPAERVLSNHSKQQLSVLAFFSDGTSRDVTGQTVYQSNEPGIATVDGKGKITTGTKHGLFAVMIRYGGLIRTFHGAVPFIKTPSVRAKVDARLNDLTNKLSMSEVDRELIAGWRRLGLAPSDEVNDAAFIRRVSVDICGILPTAEEVQAYCADTSLNKREQLINRLLERPDYSAYFALKWADLLQNRGAGYSTSKQRAGTALFAGWLRDSIAENKPYDQFVAEILTASGSQAENPPTVWYRSVRTLPDYVEAVAPVFLGTRLQCAQCHHHPFERWSQADYYGLAAVFARVGRKSGFADAEVPTEEVIHLKSAKGNVVHPRNGRAIAPKTLGGPTLDELRFVDPRVQFSRWLTGKQNPFFARTYVNRMWAHFMGRGIIHPIDDARSTNPPTNPKLLRALEQKFIADRYDVKELIRTICNSYAYRLSSQPNEWNDGDVQSYARFYPRRLSAEVLLDSLSQVLDAPTEFSGGPGKLPAGIRAIELPDENVPNHFLDVFGRPARTTSCDCERTDSPALAQALELINSSEIQRKLSLPTGFVAKLAKKETEPKLKVEAIFERCFARQPNEAELKTALQYLGEEKYTQESYAHLVWSLLATNEFMFNH